MIMKTWEKIFYFATGILLVVLFFLSYVYSFDGGEEGRIYNIAVIINESSDIHYKNMRKGMDHGVTEFHIDLNFITLYNDGDFSHQEELINRELENGVDGIVVIPANGNDFYSFIEDYTEKTPMVLLFDEELPEDGNMTAAIAADNEEMGRMLGERVASDSDKNQCIYILAGDDNQRFTEKRYNGLLKALKDSGHETFRITGYSGQQLEAQLLEIITAEEKPVFVALDEKNLLLAGGLLENQEEKASLYGIGSSNQIIHYLETGAIEGVAAPDYFGLGYLAMEQCVKAIRNEAVRKNIIVKSILVDSEGIYEKENERILFPVS